MTQIESTDTALRLAIVRRGFTLKRRGYDPAEVDELLDTVTQLADELLRQAAAGSRLLAEAEAELVGARAEVRELQEVSAATEQLLASTRAELRDDRHAAVRDSEAEEKLVVAEAELRVLRASADDTERALRTTGHEAERELAEARQELAWERAALVAVEGQLVDAQAQLAALAAERPTDPFDRVGAEVAGLLRAAAEAADEVRERSHLQASVILAEAEELAAAVLEDAEAKSSAAEELLASVSAASAPADPAAIDQAVRRSLEAAQAALLDGESEAMADLRPFAMEANSAEGAG